jgi:hypothetical protein
MTDARNLGVEAITVTKKLGFCNYGNKSMKNMKLLFTKVVCVKHETVRYRLNEIYI